MFGKLFGLVLFGVVAVCAPVLCLAQATPTLPDVGVNITGWITTVAGALGAIVVVALGAYFAFQLIRRGMSWFGRVR